MQESNGADDGGTSVVADFIVEDESVDLKGQEARFVVYLPGDEEEGGIDVVVGHEGGGCGVICEKERA